MPRRGGCDHLRAAAVFQYWCDMRYAMLPACAVFLLAAATARAGDANSPAAANGAWTIVLGEALPGGGSLTLHLRTRGGRIVQTWATTVADNIAHDLDATGLKLDGAALRGQAVVTIRNVVHRYRLDVKCGELGLTGSFHGLCGLSDAGELAGKVSGSAASCPDLAAAAQFELHFARATPGMTGAISSALLTFTLRGGTAADPNVACASGRKPAPHWRATVDRLEVAWNGRTLSGTLDANVAPTGFLWHGGGLHRVRFEARQVGSFLYGSSTTVKDGKEVCSGAMEGTVRPADGAKADQATTGYELLLGGVVDGQDDAKVYLERRGGQLSGVLITPRSGAAHKLDTSALKLAPGRLAGTVRVDIRPDQWGRGGHRPLAAELNIDAALRDGNAVGAYKGRYDFPIVEGTAAGERKPAPAVTADSTFAAPMSYPCWRGPYGNGSSPPSGYKLVDSLADMRLVWVSEARLPTSWIWRADSIGGISGGYCTPIFANIPAKDGPALPRVYVFYYVPSGPVVAGKAVTEGRDKDRWRRKYRIDADDIFECIDAVTGQTVWKRVFAGKGLNVGQASGLMTPCVAGGRLYGIGSAGRVYCLDAAGGEPLWESSLGPGADEVEEVRLACHKDIAMPVVKRGFCSAATVVDGVVACNDNRDGLIGLDAATGKKLWGPIPDCSVYSSSPVKWTHKGKDYIIAVSHRAVCVEPRTGRVVWATDGAAGQGTPAVSEDYMVCGGGDRRVSDKIRPDCGLSGYRIDLTGAKLLWDLGRGYNNHVCSPVIYRGRAYAFSGQATICVELETGKVLAQAYFPGVRTCSSIVAADGRILRENLYQQFYYYSADPGDFRRLGGVWTPPSHAECTTSTMVDGRLFLRGHDRLYCYDMRKPAGK